MNYNKTTVLFFLHKVRLNNQGTCPLRCRITYLKKRKEFSTGIFVSPKSWNSKKQKLLDKNTQEKSINIQLSLIKQEINQAFLFLQVNKEFFDVEDIYLHYTGKSIKQDETVLQVFKTHNDRVEKLIGREYVLPTLWKFKQAKTLLKEFISYKYSKNDYQFKDLELKFIKDYEFFLKSEKKLAQSTIYKTIQRFRKIIKIAISEGYLDKDPFILYKSKRYKPEVVYLTEEELKSVESFVFEEKRLERTRDSFVFCCYTGLAFSEMDSLKKEHLKIGFDKNLWIQLKRSKTSKLISIPLLPKAIEIIEKYDSFNEIRVLPKLSNQKFNKNLKEIASKTKIKKRLTHHIARKTFATTVLLYNDVPMEIVSELLGHSSITITEAHYGKIVQKKVSEQMKSLSKKLNSK